MTATDDLRRILDERGIEHCDFGVNTAWGANGDMYTCIATEVNSMIDLSTLDLTPAQAIEATLGRRKCTICDNTCSVCHCGIDDMDNYCPTCGSEVEGVISK